MLAACEGREALDQQLGGSRTTSGPKPAPIDGAEPEPPGAYLQSITVEGFCGIGPRATLTLTPGPGLMPVVRRNGSGKSSCAEGLEFLRTASKGRWVGRRASASVEGRLGTSTARTAESSPNSPSRAPARRPSGACETDTAAIEQSDGTLQAHEKPKKPLGALGWDAPLSGYRPFLPSSAVGDSQAAPATKLANPTCVPRGLKRVAASLARRIGAIQLHRVARRSTSAVASRAV